MLVLLPDTFSWFLVDPSVPRTRLTDRRCWEYSRPSATGRISMRLKGGYMLGVSRMQGREVVTTNIHDHLSHPPVIRIQFSL